LVFAEVAGIAVEGSGTTDEATVEGALEKVGWIDAHVELLGVEAKDENDSRDWALFNCLGGTISLGVR